MSRRPRYLSKHDVEQLLASVEGPSASALEEITVLRVALGIALAKILPPPLPDPTDQTLGGAGGDDVANGAEDRPTAGLAEDADLVDIDQVTQFDQASWPELVDAATRQGRWGAQRQRLLAGADRPDLAADPEAVLDALWDLAQELNELRTIAPENTIDPSK